MAKDPIWGDAGLSIFVLPSAEQGDALLSVAQAWTGLKLLGPSIWVNAERYDTSAGLPPRINALVLGGAQGDAIHQIEVDLFEQLARQDLNQVRLIVIRTAVPNLEFDEKQDELVEVLAKYLEQAVPRTASSKGQDSPATTLSKINLLTGPTEFIPENQNRMVNPMFNAHFVASTEDRSNPMAGDAFVRFEPGNSRFAGFTLLHVATLGALWLGLPRGGYDLAKKSNWTGDKVYVSRVFVNAILTDGLIQRACARVLKRAANAKEGFTDLSLDLAVEGTYPIPDQDADRFIDLMVDQTFAFHNNLLQYKDPPTKTTPDQMRFTAIQQLIEFFIFAGNKLIRVPYFAWLWVWSRFIRGLNVLFQGGGRGAAKVVGPENTLDPRDTSIIRRYESVTEAKKKADEALVSPVGKSPLRSTPELWGKIRRLVFGFLDGSNLHEFGIAREDNGWPIFYRVSSMFSDPAETLQIKDPADPKKTVDLRWMDLEQADAVRQDLLGQVTRTQHAMSSTLDNLVRANREAEELEEQIRDTELQLDLADIEANQATSENS